MVKKDTFPRGTAVTAVEILVFNTRHHAGEPGSMEQATGGEPGFIKQWQRMGPGREWAGRSSVETGYTLVCWGLVYRMQNLSEGGSPGETRPSEKIVRQAG